MSNRGRRFAGARLAALPVDTIPEELQGALARLHQVSMNTPAQALPDDIIRKMDVPGISDAKLKLWATPSRLDLNDWLGSADGASKNRGNAAELQKVIDAAPNSIYDLSWELNDQYASDNSFSPREKMRIARAAERGWQDIIPQLKEGQLVGNHPFGVENGDFGRADLYMKYGLGPVQHDLNQYGIVHNGRIEPISPMGPDVSFAKHLADRAHHGGELELEDLLKQNIASLEKGSYAQSGEAKREEWRESNDWFNNLSSGDQALLREPDSRRERQQTPPALQLPRINGERTSPSARRGPQPAQFRNADDAIHQIEDNLGMFNDRIGSSNGVYRNMIGADNMDRLISQERVRPNPEMRGRDALGVLIQENEQPGTIGAHQLAQALVNLRQIQGNGFRVVRGAV